MNAVKRVVLGMDLLVKRRTKRVLEQLSTVSPAVEPPPDVFASFCIACGCLCSGGMAYCMWTVEKQKRVLPDYAAGGVQLMAMQQVGV